MNNAFKAAGATGKDDPAGGLKTLGEDLLRAFFIRAAETAGSNHHSHLPPLRRQVRQRPPITAVEPPRWRTTGWTAGNPGARLRGNHQSIRGSRDLFNRQSARCKRDA